MHLQHLNSASGQHWVWWCYTVMEKSFLPLVKDTTSSDISHRIYALKLRPKRSQNSNNWPLQQL